MKKKISMIIVLLMTLIITGCSQQSTHNDTITNNDKQSDQETIAAWNEVDQAFDKLSQTNFYYDGYTTEIVHIEYDASQTFNEEKQDYEKDKNKLRAGYEQNHITADISSDHSSVKVIDRGFIKIMNSDNLATSVGEESIDYPYSLEEAMKDHTDVFNAGITNIYELSGDSVTQTIETTCYPEVSDDEYLPPYPCEETETLSKEEWLSDIGQSYLNYLDKFKQGYENEIPSFLHRGKSSIRLIPNNYFTGNIEETDQGIVITFLFTPESSNYEEYLNSETYAIMQDEYSVIDAMAECETGEEGCREWTQLEKDGSEKKVYLKKAFVDELKEARIVVSIDKDGYPTSYKRYTYMNYPFANTTVPYAVEFTFAHK